MANRCLDMTSILSQLLMIRLFLLQEGNDSLSWIWHKPTKMPLDEQYQTYCTVNTHQKYCQFNRLLLRVASAPAIFQRTMDTLLQGIPHVQCYIDDLLITSETEEEPLHNLEEKLKRIVRLWNCAQEVQIFLLTKVSWVLETHNWCRGSSHISKKVEALFSCKHPNQPINTKCICCWHFLKYYGKFLHNLSTPLSSQCSAKEYTMEVDQGVRPGFLWCKVSIGLCCCPGTLQIKAFHPTSHWCLCL